MRWGAGRKSDRKGGLTGKVIDYVNVSGSPGRLGAYLSRLGTPFSEGTSQRPSDPPVLQQHNDIPGMIRNKHTRFPQFEFQ
jgi:hypothetical protein